MSWDPITRIIGSLGVYTKIDFKNKEVAECHAPLQFSAAIVSS
jgi:hydrogenase large subunit